MDLTSLTLPSIWYIIGSLIFSSIGLWAFRDGKKNLNFVNMSIGVALFVYSYFTTNEFLVYGIGLSLCAGLYYSKKYM